MQKKLAEIAGFVGGEVVGDKDLIITGLSGIKEAKEGQLTFVANPKYFPLAKKTKASAILVPLDTVIPGKSIIRTQNPSLAFSNVLSLFSEEPDTFLIKGVHEKASVATDAEIGQNVTIGPFAVVEAGVKIGDGSMIGSNAVIGHHTTIGENCVVSPNVTIRERVSIGNRVMVHSGTVIGSDDFGFVNVDGVHKKIPQTGTVVIEDDVEIGANVTIDRARFDTTRIGRGTKIDNLVQIAHNVQIGEHCLIVAQVGISGSTLIEKNVVLAGQAGVSGHLTIGEGAIVASQSGVTKSIPAHTQVSGYPAKPHHTAKRINASLQRLPGYVKLINELKKKVDALEEKLKK